MRILFLCSSLELGRDGVGDYTRRLSGELVKAGHECVIVAVNDCYALSRQEPVFAESFKKLQIPTLFRLPKLKSWSHRFTIIRSLVHYFDPDWISLQYVPHGLQEKGLPFPFAWHLGGLGARALSHIMFHELWVEPRGGFQKKILSLLQRRIVSMLWHNLQPKVVHTSNPYYASRLESAGIPCGELPLFGNIPVVQRECPRRVDEWVFVFFGSLRRGWEPEPLLSKIESARAASGKAACRFVSIGRLGMVGELLWDRMENAGYRKFSFHKRGELPPPEISHALQSADFGIAVSPLRLLGKSGAVAAMREHGLPVIVNNLQSKKTKEDFAIQEQEGSRKHADPVVASRAFLTNRLNAPTILMDDNFELNLTATKRGACKETLPEVADQFLKDLKGIS